MEFSFVLERNRVTAISPIVLAFVGDAVYSLYVRKKLALETDLKSGKLSELSSRVVNASAQSDLIEKLLPYLTEEEADIYKRGRNAKKPSKAKHASVADYNRSTGFEAVVGYLYLIGDEERLNFILNFGG